MVERPGDIIYGVEEWPPWHRLLFLGLQHAVLVSIYLVNLMIIAQEAGAPLKVVQSAISMGAIVLAI